MTFDSNAQAVRLTTAVDPARAYRKAQSAWEQTNRHYEAWRAQTVEVTSPGPFCVVFTADQHIGHTGTDIDSVFEDIKIIRRMPHTGLWTVGDLVNNFIFNSLVVNMFFAEMTIPDEWALMKLYLQYASKCLLGSTGGNHELWIRRMSGVDYFEDVLRQISPNTFYNRHESYVKFKHVPSGAEWQARIRHKWKGSSIYNPTHGIERAAKWDADFQLGVGAHFHKKACARSFTVGTQGGPIDGLAVCCGTYAIHSDWVTSVGFEAHCRRSAPVAVIFDPKTYTMTGVDNLEMAERLMKSLYSA